MQQTASMADAASPVGPKGFCPRKIQAFLAIYALALVGANAGHAEPKRPWFKQHFITRSMPSSVDWGYGTPALADFDRDGDLDFAFGVRGDSIHWFEFESADVWKRRRLGQSQLSNLGAASMDVDGDGWTDLVTGGYWYRNPQAPREKPFTEHLYDPTIDKPIHDLVVADIDRDGRDDVVVLGDGVGCFWYSIPAGQEKSRWQRMTITQSVLTTRDSIHSGFSPKGIADLDADGDVDIVLPDRWLENQQQGREWRPHSLPFGKRGPWGLSSHSWIVDLDRDGDNDIVTVDSDQQQSRAAWLESDGQKPPSFTRHWLPSTAAGERGSFHSLAVADFDGDGDDDIFTAEQEDATILPKGAPPRWYIWENVDGRGTKFVERVVFDGRLGGHDVIVGDVDNDGDLDICTKIWKRWAGNGNSGREHASFLENLSR